MIQDARVLQGDFIPQEVVHRDPEVNALSNTLKPIMRGEPAETAFLLGPSGAGKTCIAQFAVERLREAVLDIEHQYVNCWQHHSRFKTLYQILDGVGETLDIHRQSTPKDELLTRLREYDGPPYVIVLDEVDQLDDASLLYDLYNTPSVSMVLIANREESLFADLDDRLQSRLHNCRRIHFDKYGIDALVDILRARVNWGLDADVIDTHLLERIADAAAGDARIAIGILRNAARDAEREGHDRISETHVEAAIPATRQEIREDNVETLSPHQRVLYDIIADKGEVTPGELYSAYAEEVTDPKTKRTLRNYLQKMRHYDLIVAEGKNRGRTYRLASRLATE